MFQELSKRQNQLEQAHAILLRHHEKTQELEYRQQKAVHMLREEQVTRFSDALVLVFYTSDPILLGQKPT